jgi:CubicO group peptidase (beta-lactamase class C family)
MANLDYGIPLTDTSRFYMASVSKQVTAAAAALLVVRGEIDYEGRVSGYIEDWPEWASEVRVKHLFNHTSGLPDIYDLMDIAGISLSNVMNIDDYMSVFYGGETLKNRPGTAYSYTNSGYTALAKLVEEVSGKSFSDFVESELLEPLGMSSTHFHDDRSRVIPNRVISYAPARVATDEADEEGGPESAAGGAQDAELPAFRQTYLSNFQGVGPGGLYSTLKDWQYWESFWLNANELSDELAQLRSVMTRREVVRGDTLGYALGLDVEVWQGVLMEGHSGSFMGFKTDVRRFPQHGTAVLTLCNREDANPGRMNRQLAKILLKDVFEAFLMPYKGIYHNEELQIGYKLTVEAGSLRLHRRLSPRGVMNEEAHDKWRAGSWDFVFQRDEDDYITGFVVSTGRAREVEFVRKAP